MQLFAEPAQQFTAAIRANRQRSQTDLRAQGPQYDKEICQFAVIHWSPSTTNPVIFQNHKEEHDSADRKGKKNANADLSKHTVDFSRHTVVAPAHL